MVAGHSQAPEVTVMPRSIQRRPNLSIFAAAAALLAASIAVVPAQPAFALITGGEGNEPIDDPGWPKGAAAIFNTPSRIAYWEGPPFGGGQWHAECRGDAKALNAVLADFAKLDVKNKRIVVHDGVGNSFWLNPNRDATKKVDAKMDWMFMVWQPESWERLNKMPAGLQPADVRGAEAAQKGGPPAQIDAYAGGNLRWADVKAPAGIEVIDERLEAHGFTPADGSVIEGNVVDLATKEPIAARMRLERVEPRPRGGYKYTAAAEVAADAKGHWVLKNAPAGWRRVVAEADGYVARIVGHAQLDEQPRWQAYDGKLARPAVVSGRVDDDFGKPLGDVEVRLTDMLVAGGGLYESPHEYTAKTDAAGRFRFEQVPVGQASIWVHKPGYCRPGLGPKISIPKENIALAMKKSARVHVTVDFGTTARPAGYIVNIEPKEGGGVGTWGGSGNIDEKNQISFEDVPPGKYVLQGRPNPGRADEGSATVTADLKGGETTQIVLFYK
jgi:Carboxypeptidase regulatory-like domain